MVFPPATADFCIDIHEEKESDMSEHEHSRGKQDEAFDIESAKKPTTLIPHRGFLDIMDTMNIKFGYNDGKLSTALDLISLYLKGQKCCI